MAISTSTPRAAPVRGNTKDSTSTKTRVHDPCCPAARIDLPATRRSAASVGLVRLEIGVGHRAHPVVVGEWKSSAHRPGAGPVRRCGALCRRPANLRRASVGNPGQRSGWCSAAPVIVVVRTSPGRTPGRSGWYQPTVAGPSRHSGGAASLRPSRWRPTARRRCRPAAVFSSSDTASCSSISR